ncbi:MAG: DUF1015 domain-containing protein [Bacteroidota bacterium]
MAIFKPFKGFRPPKDIAKQLASRPYDVINSEEARLEVKNNPYSFLRVVKPEVELDPDMDIYHPKVYQKAKENLQKFIGNGWLKQDQSKNFYLYAQSWRGKKQFGIVGCAGVQDYIDGVIKKHELTRPDKEEDRMKHVRATNANAEPVFFSYHAVKEIDQIVEKIISDPPEYDFAADDGVEHQFWVIDSDHIVQKLEDLFQRVPAFYVADGHHRTAAAALVGNEKKNQNPNHSDDEEYNFFMAVLFPHNQLTIIDYNRVVKDLNGLTSEDFLSKLKKIFVVEEIGTQQYKPGKIHEFSMYLDSKWYKLTALPHTYNNSDPIGVLDVTVLSKNVLDNILGIKNLRTDKRIDFVGGIRGLDELEKRVDSGEMRVAFALYPVSMEQLINIANTGNIMPPKTTWFEPKLRSGLVVHSLDM